MHFPFYYKTSIKTNLSQQQVRDILLMNTLTKNGKTFKDKKTIVLNARQFKITGTNYLYKSTISDKKFKIYRVLEGSVNGKPRNSFLPFCFGKLNQVDYNYIIPLTFRSARFVLLFMFIWTSGLIFGTVEIMMSEFQNGRLTGVLITPIVLSPFYLGIWVFNKFGFKKEVDKTLLFFENIGLTENGR